MCILCGVSVQEMVCVPHAVLVFLDEFLLVVLIFHPVLAWDDKVGCDSTLWARPARKKTSGGKSPRTL